MNILNKKGYNPFDNTSESGYYRPPRDPACICDYFAALGLIEDEGEFSHKEMQEMIDHPDTFFNKE